MIKLNFLNKYCGNLNTFSVVIIWYSYLQKTILIFNFSSELKASCQLKMKFGMICIRNLT